MSRFAHITLFLTSISFQILAYISIDNFCIIKHELFGALINYGHIKSLTRTAYVALYAVAPVYLNLCSYDVDVTSKTQEKN